jgi:putative transposase
VTEHRYFFVAFIHRFQPHNLYHVYNRGNNKQPIFLNNNDYLSFIEYTRKFILPFADILAWCLMPNHFHYLVNTNEQSVTERKSGGLLLQQLTYGIKQLLSSYTKSFNARNERTGNLFQHKTKAKNLAEGTINYSKTAFYYIHQNPWTSGLVTRIGDWPYSSYAAFTGNSTANLVSRPLAETLINFEPGRFETDVYQRVSAAEEKLLL